MMHHASGTAVAQLGDRLPNTSKNTPRFTKGIIEVGDYVVPIRAILAGLHDQDGYKKRRLLEGYQDDRTD